MRSVIRFKAVYSEGPFKAEPGEPKMAGNNRIHYTTPTNFDTKLFIMLLGKRGCVILFLLASIAFLIIDIQEELYLSNRFCRTTAFLLIIFFGFFGKSDTVKRKITRYSFICLGIFILIADILFGSSCEVKYGSPNVVPCKVAEYKLEAQPQKVFLIDHTGGRKRYLAKNTLSASEIESIVKAEIGAYVDIEYSQTFHRYTLRRNNQSIGSIQFSPSREFYNMDYLP